MSLILKVTVLVLALIITGFLLYFSLSPIYVLQLSVEPSYMKGVELRRDKVIFIYNSREPIFFDVAGSVDNPNLSDISLRIRGPKDSDFRELRPFKVLNGTFIEPVPLGSVESPIINEVNYTYDLYSKQDNSRLSEGHIQLRVMADILGTVPWWMVIIGGIGLLASFLQVAQFVYTKGDAESRGVSSRPS